MAAVETWVRLTRVRREVELWWTVMTTPAAATTGPSCGRAHALPSLQLQRTSRHLVPGPIYSCPVVVCPVFLTQEGLTRDGCLQKLWLYHLGLSCWTGFLPTASRSSPLCSLERFNSQMSPSPASHFDPAWQLWVQNNQIIKKKWTTGSKDHHYILN